MNNYEHTPDSLLCACFPVFGGILQFNGATTKPCCIVSGECKPGT